MNTRHASTRLIFLILLLPLGALAHIDPQADCLNNLRQLDGAKEYFALEHKLKPGDPVEPELLKPYFLGGNLPHCRAGGRYTIGPIGTSPVCSVPSHSPAAFRRDMEQQARNERILIWSLIGGGGMVSAWIALAVIANRRRTNALLTGAVQRTGASRFTPL